MKRIGFINLAVFFLVLNTAIGQAEFPKATLAEARQEAMQVRSNLEKGSTFANLKAKSIGPSIFSGRVTDIAVNPKDPSIFYVAYASGGLWKTTSNGSRFEPLFDFEQSMTIGAIAVNWETGRIWVGTGEVNSSRSSYAGNGIYYSDDEGENWTHSGLDDTHHIGRVIIHPERPNEIFVAALGHLYSDNSERGIFKSSDNGLSWNKTLYVDDKTGAVDLIIDPTDSDILYAAMWHRKRFAWNFVEAGSSSGIYKSNNSGDEWDKVSTSSSGFPQGDGVGRIGLDMVKTDEGVKIYALLDNYARRPKDNKKAKSDKLSKDDFKTMSNDQLLKLKDGKIDDYLRDNRFPDKYNSKEIRKLIKSNKIKASDLASYLEDANRVLFDTPVVGAEVYSSEDQGKTWVKTHDGYLDGLYNSYGYYFGQIRVNPSDSEEIYIMGVPILSSNDGGQSFKNINGRNVHADHHALWINPSRVGHIINGNDGGINISYDNGESWFKCNNPPVGQFYTVNVDMAEPYNVYGGTQDNGVWMGPINYTASDRWHNSGRYPYQSLIGGDGMQVQIDSRDHTTVYTGFQFGNYFRVNNKTRKRNYITPKPDLGETPYRWNWQSPILLSKHNQDILYMGSNKLLRSMDQGSNFSEISNDLTQGGQKGDVPYGTLTSIDESQFRFGLIYTGSDDGYVQITQDGGQSWTNISEGLPANMWVSRVQASHHNESSVYISLNGYRWDNFDAMVFKSEDYGKSWIKLGTDLPNEPVNVIKEDPLNENFVYVGTDHGLYFSQDAGSSFQKICSEIPAVAIHDLVIHPREGDLVVGTHGRSIYIVDMAPVRKAFDLDEKDKIQFLSDLSIEHNEKWGSRRNVYSDYAEAKINLQLMAPKSNMSKNTALILKTAKGKKIKEWNLNLESGFNQVELDLALNQDESKNLKPAPRQKDDGKYYLNPGTYTFEINGEKKNFEVKEKE